MKKVLAIILVLAMILSLAACGKKDANAAQESEQTELPSPIVEVGSLEELNEKIGCNLSTAGVMGTTDEVFLLVDDRIAEYQFTQGGCKYTYRAAKTTEDICGVYYNEETAFASCEMTNRLTCLAVGEGMVGRWFDGDMQYTLYKDCSTTGVLDQEVFVMICSEFIAQSCPEIGNAFNNLQGSYQDAWSQRAVMDIVSYGNYAVVNVHWGSSYAESDYWTMTVEKDGDLLRYSDGIHDRVTVGEKEDQIENIESGLVGCFEIRSEGLSWEGAPEKDVRQCIFVRQ